MEKQKRTYKGSTRRLATDTHCANGHPWSPETSYTPPTGQKRVCRICQRNAQQRYLGRPETDDPLAPRNGDKTHCPWGHAYTENNTYFATVKGVQQRHCRICAREHRLIRTYGLERGEYDRRFQEQEGACVICSTVLEDRNLAVDHNHDTGAVRGLLCSDCNLGLGKFKDDPALLLAAAAYVVGE